MRLNRFNYVVLFLDVETYLNDGIKFNIDVSDIVPFATKELSEQYLKEMKGVGANVILIDLNDLT